MSARKTFDEEQWFNYKLAERCLAALAKNNIKGHYARNRHEACAMILEMVPDHATIGAESSLTPVEIGIMDKLEQRGTHEIHSPFRKEGKEYFPSLENVMEIVEVGKKAILTDIFLNS